MADYRSLSLWFDQLVEQGIDHLEPRASLARDSAFDVVIVGGGLTGLWTAYYLAIADPTVSVAVVEAEIAGFGASGRNGGWASALFPRGTASLAKQHGRQAAIDLRNAMIDTVDEVGRASRAAGIDCDFVKGGTFDFARSDVQWVHARNEAAEAAEYGADHPQLIEGNPDGRFGVSDLVGTYFDPNCARIQPAKLVRGLATAVEALGVTVFEHSPVTAWGPHAVAVGANTISAGHVVLAVEGYRARLDDRYTGDRRPALFPKRSTLPLYSSMIATAPLSDATWDEIGIEHGNTFSDFRNLLIYGQRTADNRFAFGGRGARYHWASAIKPEYDKVSAIFAHLENSLVELFPQVKGTEITHHWGGPLGVPRDWHAGVGLDAETGIAWAGGYVGDGVSTTNLAGRTLADLILARSTPLTGLAWVQHPLKSWEPEPLRYIGTNLGLASMDLADAEERTTRRPSVVAKIMGPLIGG